MPRTKVGGSFKDVERHAHNLSLNEIEERLWIATTWIPSQYRHDARSLLAELFHRLDDAMACPE